MGPVSARFSLSERQTLARSTFLSRIATRFRHNACDTQPLLSEPPFVIPSGCAVPFFRTRPFARERLSRFAGGVGSRRFPLPPFFPPFPRYSAQMDLMRPTPMLHARLLPGLRSTALPRTQCQGQSGGIPSFAASMPPAVASLTPPRCSSRVHAGTCCTLADGRSGLFRSANAAAPCFPRLFRDRFLSKSPHRFSLQS